MHLSNTLKYKLIDMTGTLKGSRLHLVLKLKGVEALCQNLQYTLLPFQLIL